MRPAGRPSIAVFGSVARGDRDCFSDKDVLLVGGDRSARSQSRRFLTAWGWNCTSYGWSRLEALVSSGSLFAHHLEREAAVVCDPHGRLQDLISGVPRRSSYAAVYEEARMLLRAFEAIPRTQVGRAWAADVLMVAFRAMAVARIADDGDFAFSPHAIAEALQRRTRERQLHELFHRLRQLKWLHRARRRGRGVTNQELFKMIDDVDRVFSIGLQAQQAGHASVVEAAVSVPEPKQWYLWSRRLEAALELVEPSRTPVDIVRERDRVLDVLRAPTDYGWLMRSTPEPLISSAWEVLDRAALMRPESRAA